MEKMRQNTWKITGKFEEMIGHVVFFPDVFLGAAVVFLIRTSAEQNEAKKRKWRTPAENYNEKECTLKMDFEGAVGDLDGFLWMGPTTVNNAL